MSRVVSNILKAYNFGQLQDSVTLLKALYAEGKTVQELFDYVDNKKKALLKKNEIIFNGIKRKCENCDIEMFLSPVNTNKRDQTGDDSTFVWVCPKCNEETWTNKSLKSIIAEAHKGE